MERNSNTYAASLAIPGDTLIFAHTQSLESTSDPIRALLLFNVNICSFDLQRDMHRALRPGGVVCTFPLFTKTRFRGTGFVSVTSVSEGTQAEVRMQIS